MTEATLRDTILRIGEDARASAVAVAVYDFEHHTTWSINPARWSGPQCSFTRGSVRRVISRASVSSVTFAKPCSASSCIL